MNRDQQPAAESGTRRQGRALQTLRSVRRLLWGRWWRRVIVIVVVLVALYAAIGFWAVPALVQWQLPKQVAHYTTAQAKVGKVAFNPFTFELRAADFDMTARDGAPLLRFKSLDVNFDPARIVHGGLAFAWIRLSEPRVNVAVDKAGKMNLASLMRPRPADEKPEPESRTHKLPTVLIDDLTVTDGQLNYADASQSRDFHLALNSVDFHLKHFSTRPQTNGRYQFDATLGQGQSLAWQGKIGVGPLRSQGQLSVKGLDLAPLWPYLANRFKVTLKQGRLGVQAQYTMRVDANGLQLEVKDGAVTLAKLALVTKAKARPLVSVPELNVKGIDFHLQKRELQIGAVTTTGGRIAAALDKDHQVDLAELLKPVPVATPAPGPAVAKPTKPTKPFAITVGSAVVKGYDVVFTDASGNTPVVFDLKPIDVSVSDYSSANDRPIQIAADVGLNGGSLHVDGPVTLDPLGAQLKLKLAGLRLAPFQPYVSRVARLAVKHGTLNVQGKLDYKTGKTAPDISFDGRAGIHDLEADSGAARKPFVRLGNLAVKGIRYASRPASLRVNEVVLDKPFARLVVNPDHTTNVSALFLPGKASGHRQAKRSDGKPAAPMPVTVDRITVKRGKLQFSDRSMTPQVSVGIESLAGDVRHFSTRPGKPADVNLKGDVGPYAPVTIEGTINPLGKSLAADIGVQFKNLGLTAFSPYSGKFAGYRIKKGKADLTLHYAIHDGLMQGKNQVVLDQFELGEKVDSPDAMHLPLKLAIALLKDSHGVIKLDLPVHGDLNNPQFAIGPLILKVLGNVLTKIVTSPFHLLANLVGGSAGPLNHVSFSAGRATLSATDQKVLSTLADALAKRPSLNLNVAGVAAPSVDRDVLARRMVYQHIRPAGQAADVGGPLTPADRKRLLAQYQQSFGAQARAQVTRAKNETDASYQARVTQAALKRLVAQAQVTQAALDALAKARAEAVRRYLVKNAALDARRIFMLDQKLDAPAVKGMAEMPLVLQAR